MAAFARRITPYGWSNSLSAKLVQPTMPGVPDLYQGSELWDLALVDPDNRRPVDWLHLVSQALRLRGERGVAFDGDYQPLWAGARAPHMRWPSSAVARWSRWRPAFRSGCSGPAAGQTPVWSCPEAAGPIG